jgi:alcohol dehydrogenase class IV
MRTVVTQIIGPRECPYTWQGRNLAEMRKAELNPIAKALGVFDPNVTKNDLLLSMIGKLRHSKSELELTDNVAPEPEEKKPAKKKPASKKSTTRKKERR